ALDVVDVLDRRLLAHEEPDHQRRAAHHEPHVRRVRERVPAADLVGGSAVGEPQIDAVLDAELHLTAIDERQHRAGAGVRLYDLHAVSLITGIVTAASIVFAFLTGWPSIIAVILNYVKRSEARGTWLESHFRWQIRTFWYGLLWVALCLAFVVATLGIGLLIA